MPEGTSATFTFNPANTAFSVLYGRALNYVHMPTGATEAVAVAKEGINDAIAQINTRDWNSLREMLDITLVAGTREYALDARFRNPISFELINSTGNPGGGLAFYPWKTFNIRYPDRRATSGSPEAVSIYSLVTNGYLTLNVEPTAAFVATYAKIRTRFYARLPVLSADADTLGTINSVAIGAPPEFEIFLVWYARALLAAIYRPEGVPYAERRWKDLWDLLLQSDRRIDTTAW
jgi:hypothetical protein